MTEELLITGTGRQGILFIGTLIALAATEEGKHTTWFPDYEPATMGGKVTCVVIVSSEKNDVLTSEQPDSLIVMDKAFLDLVKIVKPGGLVIINKSLVDWDFSRKDIEILEIRADYIAKELGNPRVANTIILGVYLNKKRIVDFSEVLKALPKAIGAFPEMVKLSEKERVLLIKKITEINEKALQRGWDEAK